MELISHVHARFHPRYPPQPDPPEKTPRQLHTNCRSPSRGMRVLGDKICSISHAVLLGLTNGIGVEGRGPNAPNKGRAYIAGPDVVCLVIIAEVCLSDNRRPIHPAVYCPPVFYVQLKISR